MERKKKKDNGGFYVALCCCAVVIAIMGYAGRNSVSEDAKEKDIAHKPEVKVTPPESKPSDVQEVPVKEEKKEEQKAETKDVETVSKNIEVEEKIEFRSPVAGKVIEEFSGDDLVYNEALKDWRAHCGVDFEAKIGEDVNASAKGVVESVFDSNMGRCVIIDHQNGFKTMYANLEENDKVKEGDLVMAGDVIGTVGNTALGDITDLEHVHFEMIKEGESINPVEFLN